MEVTMFRCPKCTKVAGVVTVNGKPEPCFACGGTKTQTPEGVRMTRGSGYLTDQVAQQRGFANARAQFEALVQEKRDYSLAMRAIEQWEQSPILGPSDRLSDDEPQL